jgi:hypothetical protein
MTKSGWVTSTRYRVVKGGRFACTYCDKEYGLRGDLYRHQRNGSCPKFTAPAPKKARTLKKKEAAPDELKFCPCCGASLWVFQKAIRVASMVKHEAGSSFPPADR